MAISNIKYQISNILSNPLFSGSAIMIFGSNAVSFLNYLYHLVMGRMLGPSFYGELASLISLIGLLGIIPLSLSLVVIKYISAAQTSEEESLLINWLKSKLLLMSLLFFIVIIITTPLVASFLHIEKLSYLMLIAVIFVFSLQANFNRSILQGLLKFKEMVLSILVENGLKLTLSIALIIIGFRVGGAIAAFALATFLGWYITGLFLKNYSKYNSSFSPNTKSMLLFAIPVALQTLATTSIYSSDVILVKHFFSSHEAGLYAALSVLGKIIFFGAGPISGVMFPLISKRKSQGQDYSKIFLYSFIATTIMAAGILLIFFWAPNLAIELLYGSAYLEASGLLVWFGVFMSFFTLSYLLINYSLSLGRTTVVFLPLFAAVLQIILIWFFHNSLQEVIYISIIVTALLLLGLSIYSIYGKALTKGDKINFSHSPGV